MHQDIFRLAVHRSLSKSLNPREVNNKSSSSVSLETLALEASTEKRYKEKEKYEEEKVKATATTEKEFTELTQLQSYKPCGGDIQKKYAINSDAFSKNLAETLLRGAIDLQVSIDMLENFQENVNRRKWCPGKGDEIEGFIGGLNVNRYISNGASSRQNTEGLKKVIKESLYKQNLFIASSDDEKNSSNWSFKGGSNCNNTPGIVAKLMGLKETPTGMVKFQSTERDAKGKGLSPLRALFDLERMPRVRKEIVTQERIDPNRKALLDIMETMQFRGLMRSNQGAREATEIFVREDQSAKSVRKENGTFEEYKLETSKIVKINNAKNNGVVRRPGLSVKKNEETNGVNSTTSKSMQRSERKVMRSSSGASTSHAAKPMPHNSSIPTKKRKSLVPRRNESSSKLVDRKIKREGKGFNAKIQRNGGTTNIHSRHLESNSKLKRPDAVPSVEGTNKPGTRHSLIEEEQDEEKESIYVLERAESDITLLLLGNKSFTTFAKGDLKLCLDTAREQVARKNLKNNLFYPPYHVSTIARRPYFSIENLVSEITNGIRKLNGYKNLKETDASKDGLYLKLERDLKCSDLGINSVWDFGWLDWICGEEASNIVSDFADYALSLLIEEVSLDLYTF